MTALGFGDVTFPAVNRIRKFLVLRGWKEAQVSSREGVAKRLWRNVRDVRVHVVQEQKERPAIPRRFEQRVCALIDIRASQEVRIKIAGIHEKAEQVARTLAQIKGL